MAKSTAGARTAPPDPPTVDKSRALHLKAEPGKSVDRQATDLVARGLVTNAATAMRFVQAELGELSITEMVESLQSDGEAINRNDLTTPERMLNSQAVALNAIFGELARRSALNMGEHLGAAETYMRLALKAQSQSRATFETLAAIKNPPVVFAKQMNVANGPQQVNNEATPRTQQTETQPNKLSGAPHELCQDTRASQAAGRAHPRLEPLEAIHRAADT